MQFAIASKDGTAWLWCEQHGVLSDGRIAFEVINGSWKGIYDPKKEEVYVDRTGETHYGKLVWQGRAPFSLYHYNEALSWINEQVVLTGGTLRDWIYVDASEADYTEEDEIPF